jgi:hypothetical protein
MKFSDELGPATCPAFSPLEKKKILANLKFVHILVCRKSPFDTLMIFTTTISVNSIYSTSNVVVVPIIWLYMKVVVVIISFSIIV